MFRKVDKKNYYLIPQQLENLKDHKYSCTGKSFLEPIFQKFWNWLIDYVPSNIAPNTLTLVGLLANVVSVVILAFISPDAKSQMPCWSLLFCAFGLFFYQTLDALDGKQARKTNTSSQLGELFDHGCDAVSTNFVVLGNILAVGMGEYPWLMFLHFFITVCAFYMAHWQVYVTGTLEFGKLDVTESQLAVIMDYLFTTMFGLALWDINVPVINVQLKLIHFFCMVCGGLTFCWRYLLVILSGGCGRHGATIANTSILFPFCPIALVVSMAVTVAIKSPVNIYEQHPVLFLLSFGMVACKVTQKLVVAHMTKSELVLIDTELFGPILLILNQYWFNSYFDEYLILWICLIFTSWNIIMYARSVCLQIADFLNIYMFCVSKRPEVARGDQAHLYYKSPYPHSSNRPSSSNVSSTTAQSKHSTTTTDTTTSHKPYKQVTTNKINIKFDKKKN